MDYGHYHCRDYAVSPDLAPATTAPATIRHPIFRHESWEEMEQRCRSPASTKPKFPLLRLPLELRQHIFSYLLPRTDSTPGATFNWRARKTTKHSSSIGPSAAVVTGNVVWQRGNVNLLRVCKQLHDECADMIYGNSTFLLSVNYNDILFCFRWLSSSGVAPTKRRALLEMIAARYIHLIKKVVIQVDHVDPYTGMLKFNVGGKGLTHGMKRQVQRLVNAFKAKDEESGSAGTNTHLNKINVRVSNSNTILESIKSEAVHQRKGHRICEGVEEMLEPFGQLYGVHDVMTGGAVSQEYARDLESKMRSTEPPKAVEMMNDLDAGFSALSLGICVYGNDMA
jgi:hypothetical protein